MTYSLLLCKINLYLFVLLTVCLLFHVFGAVLDDKIKKFCSILDSWGYCLHVPPSPCRHAYDSGIQPKSIVLTRATNDVHGYRLYSNKPSDVGVSSSSGPTQQVLI